MFLKDKQSTKPSSNKAFYEFIFWQYCCFYALFKIIGGTNECKKTQTQQKNIGQLSTDDQ